MRTRAVYCGDNLQILSKMPADSVDLIYLDPPFFSNRKYEVVWGDEGETRSFEDRWEGGIEVYVAWMRERVIEMKRVLKDTGSIYLHCDWHASHYLKVMMDDVFGYKNFRNEIVWHYNSGARGKLDFGKRHDIIFRYSVSKKYIFNPDEVRVPYSSNINIPPSKARYYHPLGKVVGDVWKINIIAQNDKKERLGYPTQKPEALLERIVKASSNEGDIVLDPFCGCGTALAVAERLGRKWVGIDVSPTACKTMECRLRNQDATDFHVIGMPQTEEELKSIPHFEFQNWVVIEGFDGQVNKKTGDKGIDGFTLLDHYPIQVKQSERVGRNVVDNFETAMRRKKRSKGYIVAFSFTKGSYEEVARVKREGNLDIKLLTVKDLLDKQKAKRLTRAAGF